MTKERTLNMAEAELPPIDAGRHARPRKTCTPVKVRKVRIMKRLRDSTGTSPDTVRNRVILQEMRRSYNMLTGVGDNLVDTRLSQIMCRRKGVASLGKQDLCALNYDLASLASTIFGPVIARRVYEHIGDVISETFA
ncbi:MAG: hypothetical protein JSW25_05270 [Thermoplasmata archaeon]|nr:MAG: hypothetical protein JSW25_05270 [Thermoplasmata archaeon]